MKRRRILPLTTNNQKTTTGFTLIELLVVISIIAALVAILVPCLQGARRRAGAAACQARLRQWGMAFKMYLEENKGRWMSYTPTAGEGSTGSIWLRPVYPFWSGVARGRKLESRSSENDTEIIGTEQSFAMCPITGQNKPYPFYGFRVLFKGRVGRSEKYIMVSYAFNSWLYTHQVREGTTLYVAGKPVLPGVWGTCDVRGASVIPVLGDGICDGYMCHDEPPPKEESGPTMEIYWRDFCINRHNGGINMLFMDWSVHKVGLKELWTLKWSRTFDTAGPRTTAGGVKPEAWPEWMRRFKDY